MSTKTTSTHSRRALLSGAVGAAVATIAGAGRPHATQAADGDPMMVGGVMLGTSRTDLTNYGGSAFYGGSDGGPWDSGLYGEHGSAGIGVRGTTVAGGLGVYANSSMPDPDTHPTAHPTKTGVYGFAPEDGTSVGVLGQSASGSGVVGFSGSGARSSRSQTGVYGQANQSTTGIGVRGHSASGTGVYASSTTGTSLRATGRVRFDKSAGIAVVASGNISVLVTPGVDLVSTSAVVASLMGSAGGTTTVHRCVVDSSANRFTIFLTANTNADVKVAWHVFG